MDLSTLIDKLRHQGEIRTMPKASDVLIRAFELRNEITLPENYKQWLLYSDGGEIFPPAGVQFHGVAHKPLIDVGDNDRPSANYVVIGALASGDPILCERNAERISIYNHEASRIEDDEIFVNFRDFLERLGETLGQEG